MDAEEIIANIGQVYERCRTPASLRMHMARVASVAAIVCAHWKGTAISTSKPVAMGLVHDVGNIVRFDFESERTMRISTKGELDNIGYWKDVVRDAKARYGTDDHIATMEMLKEVGVDKSIIDCVGDFRFEDMVNKGSIEMKIFQYGDCRVGPFGVLTIDERFENIKERRPENDWDSMKVLAKRLESDVLGNTDLSPGQINDESIRPFVAKYYRE